MESPTTLELFGPNPWIEGVGGVGPKGVTYQYNSHFFATDETAAKVAKIVEKGCGLDPGDVKIVSESAITPFGPFKQTALNTMIVMPDESHHYAGLIAWEFGTGQSLVTINNNLTAELGMTFTYTK